MVAANRDPRLVAQASVLARPCAAADPVTEKVTHSMRSGAPGRYLLRRRPGMASDRVLEKTVDAGDRGGELLSQSHGFKSRRGRHHNAELHEGRR